VVRLAAAAPGNEESAHMRKHMRKPPEPRVIFQARIRIEAEKRRLKLQRALGNISNGELVERALRKLEADSERAPKMAAATAAAWARASSDSLRQGDS
jgi:hypothetical protein